MKFVDKMVNRSPFWLINSAADGFQLAAIDSPLSIPQIYCAKVWICLQNVVEFWYCVMTLHILLTNSFDKSTKESLTTRQPIGQQFRYSMSMIFHTPNLRRAQVFYFFIHCQSPPHPPTCLFFDFSLQHYSGIMWQTYTFMSSCETKKFSPFQVHVFLFYCSLTYSHAHCKKVHLSYG